LHLKSPPPRASWQHGRPGRGDLSAPLPGPESRVGHQVFKLQTPLFSAFSIIPILASFMSVVEILSDNFKGVQGPPGGVPSGTKSHSPQRKSPTLRQGLELRGIQTHTHTVHLQSHLCQLNAALLRPTRAGGAGTSLLIP
jgi:hypothetical protein